MRERYPHFTAYPRRVCSAVRMFFTDFSPKPEFRTKMRRSGVQVIRLPPSSPNLAGVMTNVMMSALAVGHRFRRRPRRELARWPAVNGVNYPDAVAVLLEPPADAVKPRQPPAIRHGEGR
jgi:hypothetical protein